MTFRQRIVELLDYFGNNQPALLMLIAMFLAIVVIVAIFFSGRSMRRRPRR